MARVKQTARKSTGGMAPSWGSSSHWNNTNNNNTRSNWNKVYKDWHHQNNTDQFNNFGSMRRGSSTKYHDTFQAQLQLQQEQQANQINVHSQSVFNDINVSSKAISPNTFSTMNRNVNINKNIFKKSQPRRKTVAKRKRAKRNPFAVNYDPNKYNQPYQPSKRQRTNTNMNFGYPSSTSSRRKSHRFRAGTVANREIKKYQNSTELLLPRTGI